MTRGATVLVAALVVAAYHAMGQLSWVAVYGIDPWPWVRATFVAALVVVGVLSVLITAREERLR